MQKAPLYLNVEVRNLPAVQVIHHIILLRDVTQNPDQLIRPAFNQLRQRVTADGLNPDELLHIGIPELVDGQPVSYDCCIEFPFGDSEDIRILPEGRYAVLIVDKTPSKIGLAIRAFRGDYLVEHGLVVDEDRPVYEYYFKDTLEYCVPVR